MSKEIRFMYEQDLPKMTDEEYGRWFERSIVYDGVRIGPSLMYSDKLFSFTDDVQGVIDRHREMGGVSFAEAVGCLEFAKERLIREAYADE